jgi:hypothetical protein
MTAGVRRRLTLYTACLYMIMAIQGATRGWGTDPEHQRFRSWVMELLDAQLASL